MENTSEDLNSHPGRTRTDEISQGYQTADFIAVEQSQIDSLVSKAEIGDETESYDQVLPLSSVRQSSQPCSSRPRHHYYRRYLVEGQEGEKEQEEEEEEEEGVRETRGARSRATNLSFYTRFQDDFDESDMVKKGL